MYNLSYGCADTQTHSHTHTHSCTKKTLFVYKSTCAEICDTLSIQVTCLCVCVCLLYCASHLFIFFFLFISFVQVFGFNHEFIESGKHPSFIHRMSIEIVSLHEEHAERIGRVAITLCVYLHFVLLLLLLLLVVLLLFCCCSSLKV